MISTHTVLAYAVLVFLSCLVLVTTAPADVRPLVDQDETKVSVILGALANQDAVPLSRTKRHAVASRDTEADLLAAIDADSEASPAQRRQRRSAVFYLTASMQFCKNYPIYCRRVEVDEGDVKVKIHFAEE